MEKDNIPKPTWLVELEAKLPLLMDSKLVAATLGISSRKLFDLHKDGRLRRATEKERLGKSHLYHRNEVLALLAELRPLAVPSVAVKISRDVFKDVGKIKRGA